MSSFIVGDKTINRFLTWVYGVNSQSIVRSSIYNKFKELGYSLDYDNKDNEKEFQRLGEDMLKLNYRAVNSRYNHDTKATSFKFSDVKVKDVQVLKSLQCYLYQCAEEGTVKDKLYKALRLIEGWLKDLIINKYTDYDKLEWA